MKKNIKLAAMILAAVVVAAGCGKDNASTSTKETENSTEAAVDYSEYITLGNYKGIEVEKPSTEVSDQEIEDNIQSILASNASKVEITDRDTVEEGDIANIDYKGLLNGEAFDGGTDEGYDLVIGSGNFIEGFEEQLIGARVGETKELNLTFPENYNEELGGKDVVFVVTVNSISKNVPAEFNEEFVQNNSDFKTVDEYKENLKQELTSQKESQSEYNKQSSIWSAVKEGTEVKDYPKELLDEYTEQINASYAEYAKQAGVTVEEFIQSYVGMPMEQYVKEIVLEEMIFKTITKQENLSISEEEFNTKADELAKSFNYESKEALIEKMGEKQLRENIMWEVMMEFLSANAVIK